MIKARSDFGKVSVKIKGHTVNFMKAARSAVNAITAQAKTKSSKEIRSVYNIKAKDVNKTLSVVKAKGLSSAPEGKVISKGYKALSLGKFSPTQRKAGVSVKIKKKDKKGLVKGAFKATMPSGHKGVFVRKTNKSLPIEDKFAIGVPVMFKAKAVMPKVQRFIYDKFPEILKSKLNFFNK
jgi:hypothetical protein